MLATLGSLPARGDDVAVEWKFDGQRAIVVIDADGTRVFSRNGADVSRTFPELAAIADAVGGRPMILDGEIVALDTAGRPSFARLQRRWPQQRRPDAALLREVPVRLMGFDVIEVFGEDLVDRPWVHRREVLETVMVAGGSRVLTVPKAFTGVSPADMLEVASLHGMEGIVLKRLDSPYVSGRSGLWTKIPVRSTVELAIVGFWCAGGPGGRSAVGSLLMAGHNEAGDLVAVGQVGTGFSASMRRYLFRLLEPIRRQDTPLGSPVEAAGICWVDPVYVGEVAYREYTAGRWLRHTSWKGLRDIDARAIALPPVS
ncbi:DNA ligase [Mycobacterium intracellulare]|nr:DNA ligase [Mycobacterium intracellulare]